MIQSWQITSSRTIQLDIDAPSLDALTHQLPDGYYSTFRTYGECTRVLGLSSHLRRLYEPVEAPEVSAASLRRQLRALLESYRPDEARVRVVMTRQGEAYVAIERLKELARVVYEQGVRVETTDLQREHPRLKSTTFIGQSDAERKQIAQQGIFEALLVKDGKILEGMTSNFFYVALAERASSAAVTKNAPASGQREGILCTAHNEILLGVTRKMVIAIARGRGLQVKYRPLQQNQLSATDEAFITSSSRGIVPVIQIDDVTIGQGSPGPITRELIQAYETYVLEKADRV